MAAQFHTFVSHGEQTLEESESFPQGEGTDRFGINQPALATPFPFSAAQ